MGERVYKSRAPAHRPTEVIDSEQERPRREGQRLKAELDELLAEVDEVLDGNEEFSNAQAFVDSFQQKGGEAWKIQESVLGARRSLCPRFGLARTCPGTRARTASDTSI